VLAELRPDHVPGRRQVGAVGRGNIDRRLEYVGQRRARRLERRGQVCHRLPRLPGDIARGNDLPRLIERARARCEYDPATGQFTSVDPQIAATAQPYEYGQDNPVSDVDPQGLFPIHFKSGYIWVQIFFDQRITALLASVTTKEEAVAIVSDEGIANGVSGPLAAYLIGLLNDQMVEGITGAREIAGYTVAQRARYLSPTKSCLTWVIQ
jgi:hypothetical protein